MFRPMQVFVNYEPHVVNLPLLNAPLLILTGVVAFGKFIMDRNTIYLNLLNN